MSRVYNANERIKADECWNNSKDNNNQDIEQYALYYNDNAKVEKETGTFPAVATDHINLRGRPGYGVSDDYLIDTYSSLRNNKEALTRDRCPVQLLTRVFHSNPKMKEQNGNIDRELDLLSGSDTRSLTLSRADETTNTQPFRCNKAIMELQTNAFLPMLDSIKEVQNPDNIIMPQIRGGEDTRSYLHKVKFNRCNKNNVEYK